MKNNPSSEMFDVLDPHGMFTGEIASLPAREHVDMPIKEQVIVELYSK